VEYRNRIDFTHQLVQEFFTAYALQKEEKWGEALPYLEQRNWWRTLTMLSGLVMGGKSQADTERWRRFHNLVLGDRSSERLALATCLLGAVDWQDDELSKDLALAFGVWPTHAQVEAIRDVASVLSNELIEGSISIARGKYGFAKRIGLLLLCIEGSENAISKLVHPYFDGWDRRLETGLIVSLGLWRVPAALKRAAITQISYYPGLKGRKIAARLLELSTTNLYRLGPRAIEAFEYVLQDPYYGSRKKEEKEAFVQELSLEVAKQILGNPAAYVQSDDPGMRLATVKLMRKFSMDGVKATTADQLLDAYQRESDEKIKEEIVTCLWFIRAFDATPKLIEIVKSETGKLLSEAIGALDILWRWAFKYKEIENYREPIISTLLEKIQSTSGKPRAEILGLLARMLNDDDGRRYQLLMENINDKSWEVREETLQQLPELFRFEFDKTQLFDLETVRKLYIRLASDPHPEVRRTAIEKLRLSMDDSMIDMLLKKLRWEPSLTVQHSLVNVLSYSKSIRAAPMIIAIFNRYERIWNFQSLLGKRWDEYDMDDFADALARIGSEQAIETLIRKSQSKHMIIRQVAIAALGQIKDERVSRALFDIVTNTKEAPKLRASAAKGLRSLGYAEEMLNQFPESYTRVDGKDVQPDALNVMGWLGTSTTEELLRKMVMDHDLPAAHRVQALAHMKKTAELADLLIANIDTLPEELAESTLKILQGFTGEDVFQTLCRYAQGKSSKLRAAAARSLLALEDPRASPILLALLSDEDKAVIIAAADTINEIDPDIVPEYADEIAKV
jgi:HEAT repeat protein